MKIRQDLGIHTCRFSSEMEIFILVATAPVLETRLPNNFHDRLLVCYSTISMVTRSHSVDCPAHH